MAVDEQVEILRSGVAAWSEWREQNRGETADLRSADLSETDLSGADLHNVDLRRANFRGADLSRADLNGADLSEADLSETNLSHSKLRGSNLSYAKLSNADLSHADLTNADLSRAHLSNANLRASDLSGVFLSGAYLELPLGVDDNFLEHAFLEGAVVPYEARRRAIELLRGGEGVRRSIEFPPEYRDAGVAILNYFATYIEHKYPDERVAVQIEQDGAKVTMTVRTHDGHVDVVEKALEEFGLVVTGQKRPEDVLSDPAHVLDLKSQLRSIHARLEDRNEIIGLQRAQLDELGDLLMASITTKPEPPAFHATISPVGGGAIAHASANASATVNISGLTYAIQGALNDLADHLPTDSPAREQAEDLEQALDTIAEETDPKAIKKSKAGSKLRRFVKGLGDDESDVGKTVKGLKGVGDITRTVVEKAGELGELLGTPGLFG